MKNEKQWFALDSFEDQAPALVAMCTVYKMEGFGRWIKLMMMLRTEDAYRYNLTEKYAYKVLASRLMTSEAKVKAFISDLINTYGLLATDGEYIWSPWLNERMERMDKSKAQKSRAGKKSAEQRRNAKATEGQQESNETETVLQQKTTHNITLQNTTEHNKTEDDDDNPKPLNAPNNIANNSNAEKQEEENPNTALNHPPYEPIQTVLPAAQTTQPSPPAKVGGGFEAHCTAALADERFLYPLVSGLQITTGQVGQWLSLFNRKLHFENAPSKNEQDYRRHFLSWLKFQDTTNPNPETLPLLPSPPPKQPPPGSSPAYINTPQQARAQQQQQLEDLRARTAAYARSMGIDPAQAKPLRPQK
jgi:hypothetical protein